MAAGSLPPAKPLLGADRIARMLIGFARARRRPGAEAAGRLARVNGATGLVIHEGGATNVYSLTIDAGRIVAIDVVRNPDKLRRLGGRRRDEVAALAPRRPGRCSARYCLFLGLIAAVRPAHLLRRLPLPRPLGRAAAALQRAPDHRRRRPLPRLRRRRRPRRLATPARPRDRRLRRLPHRLGAPPAFHATHLDGFGTVDAIAELAALASLLIPPLVAIWAVGPRRIRLETTENAPAGSRGEFWGYYREERYVSLYMWIRGR